MATVAAALTVFAVTAVVAGGLASPDTLFIAVAALFYVVPGLIVLVKRDWHVIGWLLLLTGAAFAGQMGLTNAYPDGLASSLDPVWVAWLVEGWLVNAVLTGVIALVVMFPDGLRDRSRKQRLTGWVVLGLSIAIVATAMLTRDVGGGTQFPKFPNPTGLGFLPKSIADLTVPLQALLIAISLLGFWLRYRRTTGRERAQYRWVGYAFALVIVGLLLGIFSPLIDSTSDLPLLPILIAIYLVPVAFSLAILRFGLYEIDRIVSRTVSYAVVAVVVALVYVIPVLLLTRLMGESNDLVVAASTLAAAAVFNPARRRIQRAVDHRFNRTKYDSQREVGLFTSRLTDEVSLTWVLDDLSDTIQRTMAPTTAAIWLREPSHTGDQQ